MAQQAHSKESLVKSKRTRDDLAEMYLVEVEAKKDLMTKVTKLSASYREMEEDRDKNAECAYKAIKSKDDKDLTIEKLEREIGQLKKSRTNTK